MPLCPLSDDWSCSVELRDLRDIRSVAALPVLLLWADTLVHILSTRSHLQPTAAACQDTFCDSRFLRPRLSGCRSHLLAEYCIQHPIPQVTALLGPESGGPPRPLLNRQSFSVYYGSIQPDCEVTFLLGPVSGEPPRCLLAGWCYRTAWPVSGDDRTVTDLPALQPWVATLVRLPLIGLIEFGLLIFRAACQATARDSCFFQPWLLMCRSYLLEECGKSCLLSEVQAPLGPVRGVPPRPSPGQRCTNTARHDPRPARSEAAHQSQQHWVTALVPFSSLEFCWQPVNTTCGEPRWIRVSTALPSHIRSQCHHHGRGCEGHRRRDVDQNMRRIAQKVEPQLMWRRKRKLVRSRGRPRLKLSPRRRRPPRPGQSGRSKQKPSHCLRAAPRTHSQAPPPHICGPADQEVERVPRFATSPNSLDLDSDTIPDLQSQPAPPPAPLPWQREVAVLATTSDNDDGRHQPRISRPASSGRAAAKMLCRAKLRCTCHFEYIWHCPERAP